MEKKNTEVRDMNLIDLIAMIGRGIKDLFLWLINLFGKMLQLIYRYKYLTLIVLVFGLAISQYNARKSNRVYKVEALAKLYGVKKHTVFEVGKQLEQHSPVFQSTSLATKLGLDSLIVSYITSIEFFSVIDYKRDSIPDVVDYNRSHSPTDTVDVVMDNYLAIRLKIKKDVNEATTVANTVVDYINNNASVTSDYQLYRAKLKERVALCNNEIERLDSVAKKRYFEPKNNRINYEHNQLFVGNNYLQLFYRDQLTLQEIKSKTETELASAVAPVVIPAGFVVDPAPVNGRVKSAIVGGFISLLISILLAYCLENRKKWVEYLGRKD